MIRQIGSENGNGSFRRVKPNPLILQAHRFGDASPVAMIPRSTTTQGDRS
jgi:hypothetical protein